MGDCQNFARWLMETPSNHKFPIRFAEIVQDRLSKLDKISVAVRFVSDKDCFLIM